MAQCKDCIHEKVCLALIKHGLPWNDGKYPAEKLCFEFLNKADVVPKSEVERLRFNLEAVLEEIPETKREVAREIFEEIDYFVTLYKEGHFSEKSLLECIAELKNKYTEGKNG